MSDEKNKRQRVLPRKGKRNDCGLRKIGPTQYPWVGRNVPGILRSSRLCNQCQCTLERSNSEQALETETRASLGRSKVSARVYRAYQWDKFESTKYYVRACTYSWRCLLGKALAVTRPENTVTCMIRRKYRTQTAKLAG
jgi:hypothetical protein